MWKVTQCETPCPLSLQQVTGHLRDGFSIRGGGVAPIRDGCVNSGVCVPGGVGLCAYCCIYVFACIYLSTFVCFYVCGWTDVSSLCVCACSSVCINIFIY